MSTFVEAVFSEVIDGFLITKPRDTVALLGDRVELDCVTNASHSLAWHWTAYGSGKYEWISRGTQKRPDVSEAFWILNTTVGQFALVIDTVLMSHAGRYECEDRDEMNPYHVEVTLLSKDIFTTFQGQH